MNFIRRLVGNDGKSNAPNEDYWLSVAQTLSIRVASLADALTKGAEAVSQDWVTGWQAEADIMANLETLEKEYMEIQSLFKAAGVPHSPNLKLAKRHLDAFLGSASRPFIGVRIITETHLAVQARERCTKPEWRERPL